MKGDTKIERYLEAKRAVNAYKVALQDEPALKLNSAWRANFTQASVECSLAYGTLTGGELARATRQLREETHGPDRA
jgi:hypothetical protein